MTTEIQLTKSGKPKSRAQIFMEQRERDGICRYCKKPVVILPGRTKPGKVCLDHAIKSRNRVVKRRLKQNGEININPNSASRRAQAMRDLKLNKKLAGNPRNKPMVKDCPCAGF